MFVGEEPYLHSPKRRAGNPTHSSSSRPIFVDTTVKISPPGSPPRTRASASNDRRSPVARSVKQLDEDPWMIKEEMFPHEGSLQDQLEFIIRYAILAPSIYNSQPWQFRIQDNTIEILPDSSRSLPVVDPHDRQLLISCGAAFFHLRLAATHFGFHHTTELQPDTETGAIARITLTKNSDPSEEGTFPPIDSHLPSTSEAEHLFHAITQRQSEYDEFDTRSIPEETIEKLTSIAEEENGIWLQALTDSSSKKKAAALIAEADLTQSDYLPFRKEVAKWVRSSGTGTEKDGVPCSQFGISSIQYWMGTFLRSGNWLKFTAEKHRQLVEDAPLVAVLGTKVDSDREWFVVGQTLAKVLLLASDLGLSVSQQNQAVELPELRGKLQSVVAQSKDLNTVSGLPQVVLRIGFRKNGKQTKHTPRRPLSKVLLNSGDSRRDSFHSSPLGSPHSI